MSEQELRQLAALRGVSFRKCHAGFVLTRDGRKIAKARSLADLQRMLAGVECIVRTA